MSNKKDTKVYKFDPEGIYTDIGVMTSEERFKAFSELLENKKVGIPFCQLGEFLLYCYWRDVEPILDRYSKISEVQWISLA